MSIGQIIYTKVILIIPIKQAPQVFQTLGQKYSVNVGMSWPVTRTLGRCLKVHELCNLLHTWSFIWKNFTVSWTNKDIIEDKDCNISFMQFKEGPCKVFSFERHGNLCHTYSLASIISSITFWILAKILSLSFLGSMHVLD